MKYLPDQFEPEGNHSGHFFQPEGLKAITDAQAILRKELDTMLRRQWENLNST